MIRVNQIKLPLSHSREDILYKIVKILRVAPEKILSWQIVKKSIDARKKPEIMVIYSVDVRVDAQDRVLRTCKSPQVQAVTEKSYIFPTQGEEKFSYRLVIVGTGPAGLFCGYLLAKHGYRPLILERGGCVEERQRDVEKFWREGVLNPSSNVQFGEGGAGTFSDGKLNTLVKDKYGRNREVLRIFVENGAPEEILYEAKPHIGTDILCKVVRSMREQISAWGGEIRFHAQVTELCIDRNCVTGVIVNGGETIACEAVILAIGHSARDTFEMLYEKRVPLEAKSFAVGLRMEHPRKLIDRMQYGVEEHPLLPAASYKVTAQTSSGRGVYSFCMCPGGYVVNASSESGKLAVNGMSYSGRDGDNSNSAMIVTVTPQDYKDDSPLAGIAFQRELEEKAYRIGGGSVPVERYGDYRCAVTGQPSDASVIMQEYPDFVPAVKGGCHMASVHDILPKELNEALVEGIDLIGQKVPGFADSGAYLSGIESRTSSPVRITRDETGQSVIQGLYPCGEGAGYAGGITSAAMDGMMIAEKIGAKYKRMIM
ncbi:MAG: FAD-dependent oxidoreductase [Lachnospiraceae bacterium]|nr:FAD-dependent oxidoreductase [Lachnospiraceae bacterium]